MFVKEVTVENQVGLHARPATFFIQKANEFKSSIWVEKEERRVNAKSLLGVLSLGIVGGTTIRIIADGADEQAAVGFRDAQTAYGLLSGTVPAKMSVDMRDPLSLREKEILRLYARRLTTDEIAGRRHPPP